MLAKRKPPGAGSFEAVSAPQVGKVVRVVYAHQLGVWRTSFEEGDSYKGIAESLGVSASQS
jgi:hypothetical protein